MESRPRRRCRSTHQAFASRHAWDAGAGRRLAQGDAVEVRDRIFSLAMGSSRCARFGEATVLSHPHGPGLGVEIGECFSRELEEGVARRHNFRGVTHRLDFFGICPACQ
jgi:hypothetical protein